jgi:transcriptional regulator with XRE-family HTH domain
MPAQASKWRLRTAEFDRLARALLGVSTDRAIAARLGVGPDTLSQLRHGRTPSSGFMAAVKREMPGVPVEQVFELAADEVKA